MAALSSPTIDPALERFLAAARALDLTRAQQARLLGLSGRTYRRRLKAGRLEAPEARVAAFLPRALERVSALFQDEARARRWLKRYNPRLGAVPAERLSDLEGYESVLLVAEEAFYGFL